ncbi:amino acid permease [Thozetella sp. PMI_491]|nr:amino acid permease [Thozetella sp. PMI_491]
MPGGNSVPKEGGRQTGAMDHDQQGKKHKLGVVSGVYIPVCLNIFSILMFLRFGLILGQVGLLLVAYLVDFITTLSLSAIASNGEVKGGGAYYLISRSLGPEFGGSIGLLFYLAQVLNTALNVVGLVDCLRLNLGSALPQGYWWSYLMETAALAGCTVLSLAGSAMFAKASNALLVVLSIAILSIPISALFVRPFSDPAADIDFTGISWATFRANLLPHTSGGTFRGFETFRDLFGILFPATSGIFAGASMSGDLKNPSKAIPLGTLWAMLSTLIAYVVVILSLASSTSHTSLLKNPNVIQDTNVWAPIIFAGEVAVSFFSTLMGIIGAAKLMQALARDRLFPGLSAFGHGTRKADEPIFAIFLTYFVAQLAMFANLNQIATFISMGYQMTFLVMNLACFLLKIGSAPNFRPGFKFFSWQTAFAGSILSACAMFFIDETYAATAVCLLVFLFLLIHFLSPPKHWGDVSQNLIYHQVRKYLLRLKPEHIKFWRPQIILLINNPRKQTRLIQFCNSMKKGALYILGHVIVTDDFSAGVHEAKLQQQAWTNYISEYSRIKAFVQLTMSPSLTWGVRNLILSAGLGGMRPNIAVLGFYNMDELRSTRPGLQVPEAPLSPVKAGKSRPRAETAGKKSRRRRGDTSARLLEGFLPTDLIRTEEMMDVTEYLTILEDLALRYRLNVAVGKGFESLETPRKDGSNSKRYIDLWPIQMSAEIEAEGKSVLTTNFDTYTLILQLGYILRTVPTWKKVYSLRVLVFVEYESEVEEEAGRVKALLDKLRIEAEVLVFWLASGQLGTYETIIHGRSDNEATQSIVDECMKDDDWWDEIQRYRGSTTTVTESQTFGSLNNVLESSATGSRHKSSGDAQNGRRPSMAQLVELPKNPTVSALSRLGVNMGIRTQNLPLSVFDDSDTEIGDDKDSDSDSGDSMDGDFNDAASVVSEGDVGDIDPVRRPLLGASVNRRKSHGDLSWASKGRIWGHKSPAHGSKAMLSLQKPGGSYGTMPPPPPPAEDTRSCPSKTSRYTAAERENAPLNGFVDSSGSGSPGGVGDEPGTGNSKLQRPALSRQGSSMRFSSTVVPETTITTEEGAGPKIMFADTEAASSSRHERPAFSRHSSYTRFTSRVVPETKISDEGAGGGPTVSFAEPEKEIKTPTRTPARSRRNSASKRLAEGDAHLNIRDLLSSYQFQPREDDESGSSYSTQGLPLSFNDLPSRAQHLILNELMRQNSHETAVLFTTLPIPEEGTCESEAQSLSYLSNIEVLCNELPPVLLILSNNMTVTVSL